MPVSGDTGIFVSGILNRFGCVGNTTNYLGTADQTGINTNISANPLFVTAPGTDFAGTNRPPVDGNADTTPAFDMGAFELIP